MKDRLRNSKLNKYSEEILDTRTQLTVTLSYIGCGLQLSLEGGGEDLMNPNPLSFTSLLMK